MPYQRPVFAGLSALIFIILGIISLKRGPKEKLNRTFSFFCFANALWVFDEYTVFFPQHLAGLWFHRAVGIGGAFLIPFLIDFVYQTVDLSSSLANKIKKAAYYLAVVFGALHLTPTIYVDVKYTPFQAERISQIPGMLYPAFGLFLLVGLLSTFAPLPFLYFKGDALSKRKTGVLMLACFFGFVSLCFFFLSFIGRDYPWIYFPFQALIGVTFSYTIFRTIPS